MLSYLDSILIEISLWRESNESDHEAIFSGLYDLDVCSAAGQSGQGVHNLPGLRRLTQDSCSINSSHLKNKHSFKLSYTLCIFDIRKKLV